MNYSLNENIIVATDLDGTLLDHFSYDWQAAAPSLKMLAEKKIPVVINTSKTFAEVVELQKAFAIDAAFIVENGSGIYISKNSPFADKFDEYDENFNRCVLGASWDEVVKALNKLREQQGYQFESYADWSKKDVIAHTGLSEEQATLSLTRQFSVPLIWADSEERFTQFSSEIAELGLRLIKGGRFIHTLGLSDKGKSLKQLKNILFAEQEASLICLGDSYNDLDMLQIADIPVFVRSPVHDFPAHQCKQDPIFTEGFGPVGWNEAITKIFKS